MIGLVLLSAAFSRYLLVSMKSWERWLCTTGALLTIMPGVLRAGDRHPGVRAATLV